MTSPEPYGPPADLLRHWLRTGQLNSQFEGTHPGRRATFASGIKAVACGMLDLAMATTDDINIVNTNIHDRLPLPYPQLPLVSPARMVTLVNRLVNRPCACAVVRDDTFGPLGKLGLRAITLQTGINRHHGTLVGRLGLMLPQRHADRASAAFSVIGIGLDGRITQINYTPVFDRGGSVAYALGLAKLEDIVGFDIDSPSEPTDESLATPDGVNSLADGLAKLGQYLTSLSETFNPNHRCESHN